jgi:hypothetical protein
MCFVKISPLQAQHNGYVPEDMNIGGIDYLEFRFCLDCGQMQNKWPLPKTELELHAEEMEKSPFKKDDGVEFQRNGELYVGLVHDVDLATETVEVSVHGVWEQDKPRPNDSIYKCIYKHKTGVTPDQLREEVAETDSDSLKENLDQMEMFGYISDQDGKFLLTYAGERFWKKREKKLEGDLIQTRDNKNVFLHFEDVKKTDKEW